MTRLPSILHNITRFVSDRTRRLDLRFRRLFKRPAMPLALLALALVVCLVALGLWQINQRRSISDLAPFFAESVRHWSGELDAWSRQYALDRDLLATVMQIESCGHPGAVSVSGAQGLFQVMPYHFAEGDDMQDPATNARRGADFLRYCFSAADEVIGATLACYNGGPGTLGQARENWSRETQSYFRWGVGIYSDARSGSEASATLDRWLQAGGSLLCDNARLALTQR